MEKRKLVIAVAVLLLTISLFTLQLFAEQGRLCRDCGTVDNCEIHNLLDSGYPYCVISGTNCTVSGTFNNCHKIGE